MTGVDTNVVVRYLIEDDPGQADRIFGFLRQARQTGEPVFVSIIVLCETARVLKTTYGKSRSEILASLEHLLELDVLEFEDGETLRKAALLARSGKGDLADYLIGHRNLRLGCRHTVTFNRSLKGTPAFRVW